MVHKDIETDEDFAKRAGYEVHHDARGWYVISPREKHRQGFNKQGLSLGDDSRQHFTQQTYAWEVAAIRARRAKR